MESPHLIGIVAVGLIALSKKQDDLGTNKVLYLVIGIAALAVCVVWVLITDPAGHEVMKKFGNR